jgi:hypothetical protein
MPNGVGVLRGQQDVSRAVRSVDSKGITSIIGLVGLAATGCHVSSLSRRDHPAITSSG